MIRPVSVTLVAVMAGGCGPGEPVWTGTTTDSARVTIVTNPPTGVWSEPDRWQLVEELRIGVVQGDPNYEFGRVGGIAVSSDSRIHVLDAQALHIKTYSAEGDFIRTVGAPGGAVGRRSELSVLVPRAAPADLEAPRRSR